MKRDRQPNIQRTSRLYDRIGPLGRFDENCGNIEHKINMKQIQSDAICFPEAKYKDVAHVQNSEKLAFRLVLYCFPYR